jgi:uroporphyrinogen-III synthase
MMMTLTSDDVPAAPLNGKKIVITRAHQQAPSFAIELERLGAEVISLPTIEIRPPQSFQPLDKALKKIPAYDWLILTSVNGVNALEKRMEKVDMSAGMLNHLSIAAIGPATRAALEQLGLHVDVMPEQYVAEEVVSALKDKVRGQKILLIRAKVARDVIPNQLRDAGAEVEVVEAYETIVPANAQEKLHALLAGEKLPDVITFTSSSTAKNFASVLGQNISPKHALKGVLIASIGPVTSNTLREIGFHVDIEAKDFTIPGLITAIVERLHQPSQAH